MEKGKLSLDELINKNILEIGVLIDKGFDVPTPKLKAFAENASKHLESIKNLSIEFANLEKAYKIAPDRKKFLELLQSEEKLKQESIKTNKELEILEQQKNKTIATLLINQSKQLDIDRKLEASKKRKIKLSAEERYELQQLNKRAKESAVLSSTLSTEYEKQAVKLIQLKRRYKDVALTEGETSKKAKELRLQIQKLDSTLKRVDASVGEYQRSVGNYGKAMGFAKNAARQMMGVMGVVGGAVLFVKVMRDAVKTVVAFEKQLIAVQKTTNFSDKEIKEFANRVITLGINLKGISTQNLLKSSEIAGQLGIKGSRNILKFSSTLEKLKLTSDIVGEESARNFAKFLEVSNDSVENADRLGSVITELGNNFATTESQILKNTTEIQKGVAIYNATAQSVIGLGAATNSLGSEAEQSRSAMQTTFKVLNEGISTGKNLEKILKLTGQTQSEFKEEFGRDSVETFRKFVKGLSDSEKGGKNLQITLKELGLSEKRTESVIGSLAKNYDVLESALTKANEEYKNNVALNNEAEKATESLSAKVGDLEDAWENFVLGLEKGDGKISVFFKNSVDYFTQVIGILNKYNQTQSEILKTTELDAYTSKVERLKLEFENVVEFAKKQGKEVDFKNFLNFDLDKKNKDLETNSVKLQKLFKIRSRLLEVEKLLKIAGPEKGVLLFEQINLKKEIDVLDIAEQKNAILKGEIRAIKELIDLENKRLKGGNDKEKQIRDIKFLRSEISKLKSQQDSLTSSDIEKSKEIKNKIKLYQEEINKILGVSRATKGLTDTTNQQAKDEYELQKFRLEQSIITQDAILDNEKSTSLEKIRAVQEREAIEIELAELTEAHLLRNKNLTKDARILIEEQTSAKLIEIYKNTNDEIDKIKADNLENAPELVSEDSTADNDIKILQDGIKKYAESLGLDGQNALDEFVKLHGDKFEAVREYYDKLDDKAKESAELRKELEEDLKDATVDFVNTLFDAKIVGIEDDIVANEDKYSRLIELAEGDAEQQENLRKKQELENKKLEEKKRKEQRKQAIFNKAINVAEIISDTAKSIIKTGANLGYPAAIPFQIGAGVVGALQLATVLATPIPKYAKGVKSKPTDGIALVGEERAEVITEPNKAPYIVDKPTLLDLPKGTEVTPSLEEYQKLMRVSQLASLSINKRKVDNYNESKKEFDNTYIKMLLEETKKNTQAIKKSKTTVNIKQQKVDFDFMQFKSKNLNW